MANEITTFKENQISVLETHDLGDIIKPLIKDIHLMDTYIAGITYLKDESVLDAVSVGDELILQREDNKFDENAILVLNAKKEKLGYIPEKDNPILARLMDAGKLIKAKVEKKDIVEASLRILKISLMMVDF